MKTRKHKTTYLKDYTPPSFLVERIELEFHLDPTATRVLAKSSLRRNPAAASDEALILHGEHLKLIRIEVEGRELGEDEYRVEEKTLRIDSPPDTFELIIETEIDPQGNKALSGLYRSSGNYCTQCEAEGFRRITYYPDRPDVLACFRTTIIGDKTTSPVLLSNGDLVEKGEIDENRHYAVWEDPFPKPCYLFALVAGDLACIEDTFTTRSGKTKTLRIYVQHKNSGKCDHAMRSLKKAMKWDEDVYGLEYDLDTYMIFAVDDFNMGAMENKGLNVFNSKYVLASPETATDTDYLGIEGVIAHEYFHNWTGNRVTCRDWFQLSLKEGLTVFRDQEFSADMNSRAVQRIEDVRVLRSNQFREDGGPMAHPVRPESYVEINNFYTVTVYNKGAELIRMMRLILGKEHYHEGIRLYFERFDGQAVTIEDFIHTMEDASGHSLTQFALWYSQAGTPVVNVVEKWDEEAGELALTFTQHCDPTPKQPKKEPFHIPMLLGLLEFAEKKAGKKAVSAEQQHLVHLMKKREVHTFKGFKRKPVVSLFREFSAPVRIVRSQPREELVALMAGDSDLFNRWDAANTLSTQVILDVAAMLQRNEQPQLDKLYIDACRSILDDSGDCAFAAQALTLPTESYIAQSMDPIEPELLGQARGFVKKRLAHELHEHLLTVYHRYATDGEYAIDPQSIAERSLKNCCLSLLAAPHDEHVDAEMKALCMHQFSQGSNMTDVLAALYALTHIDCDEREEALKLFYEKWQQEQLVIDKWFSLQAVSSRASCFDDVLRLIEHPAFSLENPNRVRSLIGAFTSINHFRFHRADGRGYAFLADHIITLDTTNPQIAARLVSPLTTYKRYAPHLRKLMKQQLQRILLKEQISADVYEIVHKSIEADDADGNSQ